MLDGAHGGGLIKTGTRSVGSCRLWLKFSSRGSFRVESVNRRAFGNSSTAWSAARMSVAFGTFSLIDSRRACVGFRYLSRSNQAQERDANHRVMPAPSAPNAGWNRTDSLVPHPPVGSRFRNRFLVAS